VLLLQVDLRTHASVLRRYAYPTLGEIRLSDLIARSASSARGADG
jgi:hypothetical protein